MMSHHVHSFVSLVYPAQSSWIALCLIPPDAQGAEHRFTPVDRLSRFLPYARYRNVRGWGETQSDPWNITFHDARGELLSEHDVGLSDLAFASRLRRFGRPNTSHVS
jgi:hypothetical protein